MQRNIGCCLSRRLGSTLFPADDDTRTGGEEGTNQPRHIRYVMNSQPLKKISKPSYDSLLSIYSMDDMEVAPLKRTRAKTPCLWIGHLDSVHREHEETDQSKTLAGQYQAVLPPRTFTPFSDLDSTPSSRKPLRKIKGQQSLRDLVTCQENIAHSDSETLVGTPSLGSPTSGHFSWKPSPEPQGFENEEESNAIAEENGQPDVGFQICMDLLMSELAAGLSEKHPTEKSNRVPGLQILLMIEAYESVQQQIRQEIQDAHVTGARLDEVKALEKTLDNWLGALDALYNRFKSSELIQSSKDIQITVSRSSTPSLRKLSRKETVYFDFEDPT